MPYTIMFIDGQAVAFEQDARDVALFCLKLRGWESLTKRRHLDLTCGRLDGRCVMSIWFQYFLSLGLGALAGSFLNVVIWRGPAMWGLVESEGSASRGNLLAPRSYCPSCRTPIQTSHNVPLISYLFLRGRCASCAQPINPRYLIVEALGAAAGLAAIYFYGAGLAAVLAGVYLLVLIALAAIDLETGYLPDMLTLPLIAIGLAANVGGLFVPFREAVIGAVAGYLSLWAVSAGYKALRGREGLGLGDAKLLAALGAWTGWMALPVIVLVAAVTTLIVVGAMSMRSQEIDAETAIPFGPALAFSGAIVFLWQ